MHLPGTQSISSLNADFHFVGVAFLFVFFPGSPHRRRLRNVLFLLTLFPLIVMFLKNADAAIHRWPAIYVDPTRHKRKDPIMFYRILLLILMTAATAWSCGYLPVEDDGRDIATLSRIRGSHQRRGNSLHQRSLRFIRVRHRAFGPGHGQVLAGGDRLAVPCPARSGRRDHGRGRRGDPYLAASGI